MDYSVSGGGQSITSGSLYSGAGAQTSGASIYLFVGKNLILGPSASISSKGTNGGNAGGGGGEAGGGGGSGGGSINIFYGNNFYNLGGILNVSGGLGGSGINEGQNGNSGGSGFIRIFKLLSN